MKIILSRKGFDQGSGGGPSPIFPDGTMVSLPIPDGRTARRYADIRHSSWDIGEVVRDMSSGKYGARSYVHLDPDLERDRALRIEGWRPAFGQTGAAQSHLAGMGVGQGDLFLFFGWFADIERSDAGRWKRQRGGRSVHAIHGWMQVGEVIDLQSGDPANWSHHPWLASHPHVGRGPERGNTIYIATERLKLPTVESPDLEGGGHFETAGDELVLSAAGSKHKSVWSMPDFFDPESGRRLSYHTDLRRWSRDIDGLKLRTVGRGQEFVIDVGEDNAALSWIAAIFRAEVRRRVSRRERDAAQNPRS